MWAWLFTNLAGFVQAHQAFLSLFALALVVTMHEKLPPPLDRIAVFVWFYSWFRDALMTFVNLRAPIKPAPPVDAQTQDKEIR